MNELELGDIVFLKSGSPRLTVTELLFEDKVRVEWVSDGGKLVQSHAFPVACLTKTEPKKFA